MRLQLNPVVPAQGLGWLREGLALWGKRPLAFVSLFVFFLMTVLLMSLLLPVLGGMLGLALLPMLTLGFMIATRGALAGGPVHVLQLVEGLRAVDGARRRAQLLLCAGYALSSLLVMLLASWVDDGLFNELQRELAEASDGKPSDAVQAIASDPRLFNGMVVRLGLVALLSVPFWHAPALVHWGHQGALQALFSSALALWRARGAFAVYMIGLAAMAMGVAFAVTLVALASGSRQWVGLLTLPLALAYTALFYVTLWFSFRDSFVANPAEAAGPTDQALSGP